MWDKVKKAEEYYDSLEVDGIWEKNKRKLANLADAVKEKGSSSLATVFPFLQAPDLLRWTRSLTEGAATVYDKAMDAEFIKTGIGGPYHRLFDVGHTIAGSLKAVHNELDKDTPAQEIVGWIKAYGKDFTTPMGMPFFNLDKADFDGWVEAIAGKIPGLDRDYLYDLASFDAMEVCAAGLSVVGVLFALKKEDKEKLAEILGAMGVSSIAAANPIMGLTCIAVTAYAYWKHGPMDVAAVVKGGGMTAVSVLIFSVLGFHILVELVIVVTLTTLLKKHVINDEEFVERLKTKIHDSLEESKDLLGLERLASLLPRKAELTS